MLAHFEQDMPFLFHYLYPTEISHENFCSKSGEDMFSATQTDIFKYDMVVDSTMDMPLPFVASYCGQLVLSTNREQSFWTEKSHFLYWPNWMACPKFISKPEANTGTHCTGEDIQVSAFNMDVDSPTGQYLYFYFYKSMELDLALLIWQNIWWRLRAQKQEMHS